MTLKLHRILSSFLYLFYFLLIIHKYNAIIIPTIAGPIDPFIMIITVANVTSGNAMYLTNALIVIFKLLMTAHARQRVTLVLV